MMRKMGKLGAYKGFLFNDTTITVASAIFLTPVALSLSSRFTSTSGNRLPVYLVVISIILFIISTMMGGIIKPILAGASLGVFFNAIISTRFGAQLASRLGQVGSG